MKVQVYHLDFGKPPAVLVAEITVDKPTSEIERALDIAYMRTQNIGGSWSMGPYLPGGDTNVDFHGSIRRIAPLHVLEGRSYGLRSSMVGDVLVVDGDAYRVVAFGFEPTVLPA
jgi:hypothetical protein